MFGMKLQQTITILTICLVTIAAESASQAGRAGGSTTQSPSAGNQSGGLRGQVRTRKGRPLAGVTIRATSKQRQYETTSAAQGEFSFTELVPDEYIMAFVKSGYKTFTTRPLTVTPGEMVRLRKPIEMAEEDAPYSVIRGAVLQGPGFTLPNAIVLLERIDGRRKTKMETISHEGGEFAFRLRAESATYRVTARADGFEPATLEITIENDEVRNVVLNLKKLP